MSSKQGLESNDRIRSTQAVDRICDEFELSWKSQSKPELETFLKKGDSTIRETLLEELVIIDAHYRAKTSNPAAREEYERRFPEDRNAVARGFRGFETARGMGGFPKSPLFREKLLNRYQVVREIGKGGFGTVYLGFDETLRRKVAIKIPLQTTERRDTTGVLSEARILAKLHHANIVPVFDAGQLDDGRIFFVFAFIDGQSLDQRIQDHAMDVVGIVELITTIAETLDYAHGEGVVHRDIKPSNILIDLNSNPHIADFGLALIEENYGDLRPQGGSLDYMSPEQFRGEGHLVDRRSDIYSVGVMLYQLLSGQHPKDLARGSDAGYDLLEISRNIPSDAGDELRRICMKTLSSLATDRYATAGQLADDMRAYLARSGPNIDESVVHESVQVSSVMPRGLRSYEESDSDFFLNLLPGPRDRSGVPDSVRFWRILIDETVVNRTFRVGVIYGPSGCGKSSLVRAGIIPLLSDRVRTVVFQSQGGSDAERLASVLGERFPEWASDSFVETMRNCRTGLAKESKRKMVVIIDQFEQWLHNRTSEEEAQLASGLRQCDGAWLQCLILVRADFWIPLTRFLRQLDTPILDGQNAHVVDLFDTQHAKVVLKMIGQSFGRLPTESTPPAVVKFLDSAVSLISEDERVNPFRLVVLTELLRYKPWTVATLDSYDGVDGLMMSFFEQTFRGERSRPAAKQHEAAACRVLKRLLPPVGSEIKGHLRTLDDLESTAASDDRAQFEELIHILDHETRIITPVDERPRSSNETNADQEILPPRHYQLTHDHLVRPLRRWLIDREKRTRKGRAKAQLDERAEIWRSHPNNRNLPTLVEFITASWLVPRSEWSDSVKRMMPHARRRIAKNVFLFAGLLILALVGVSEITQRAKVESLLSSVKAGDPLELSELSPNLSTNLRPYATHRRRLITRLEEITSGDESEDARLNAAIILFHLNGGHVEFLNEAMLSSDPRRLLAIRNALDAPLTAMDETNWAIVLDGNADPRRRVAAAGILSSHRTLRESQWVSHSPEFLNIVFEVANSDSSSAQAWAIVFQEYQREIVDFALDKFLAGDESKASSFLCLLPGPDSIEVALSRRFAATGASSSDSTERINRMLHLISKFERVSITNPAKLLKTTDLSNAGRVYDVVLALGSSREASSQDVDDCVDSLIDVFRTTPSPAVASAVEWTLRRWELEDVFLSARKEFEIGVPLDGRKWYVTKSTREMMAIVGPGEFDHGTSTGARGSDWEKPMRVQIPRKIAVATKEATIGNVKLFALDRNKPNLNPDPRWFFDGDERCPMNSIQWLEAVEYCNWLSEKEGIPENEWCYDISKDTIRVRDNFRDRGGYRLPTSLEREYFCRAGSRSQYSFGGSENLLADYAWYSGSTYRDGPVGMPVGLLKPNHFGLFDVHGNVREWCHDRFGDVDPAFLVKRSANGVVVDSDLAGTLGVVNRIDARILRGGHFRCTAFLNRSANLSMWEPDKKSEVTGFRVVRTIKNIE